MKEDSIFPLSDLSSTMIFHVMLPIMSSKLNLKSINNSRVGRTARAGQGGLSLSFISERDVKLIENIEEKTRNLSHLLIIS